MIQESKHDRDSQTIRTGIDNGCIDVDSVIDSIKGLNPDKYAFQDAKTPEQKRVNDVLDNLRIMQMVKDTKETAERLKKFDDAFANPGAKTGWGEENLMNATEYPLTRMTQNWQLLTSLYRTSWIVQRVCNVIPEDALSSLSLEAPDLETEETTRLSEEIRTTKLRESLLEALCWGRLYGGSAAIIMISGQEEDLSLPIDVNNIMPGAFRGLYVVDRWSGIYPSLTLVENERDPDFGLPDYYEVRDENGVGSYRVHHSRVLRFCGTKMPFWEQVAEQYWGTSAIESMYDELVKRDNVAHNIANLTFKANLNVLKVENLDQMFASSSSIHQKRMYQMLSAINVIENSLGIRLINSTDDFQQYQYSFAGLPEVMDSAMLDMAGATCIPATRLFGRSPAGMNSTGESDEKMYRQTLEHERAIHITPALDKLLPIVCRSALGRFPPGAKFKYPPLIEMSQMDKMQVLDQQSNMMERLFQANLIPGDVVLESFRNAQLALEIVSPIKDEHIDRVRGKYQNDLIQQADPYGGAMQAAGEAGQEPQVDENGEPIEPQVDENGNPIDPQAEQQAQEEQAKMQARALKPQYEAITNKLSPGTSKKAIIEMAKAQNISPEDLAAKLKEEQADIIDQKRRERIFEKILNKFPDNVSKSLISKVAAIEQIPQDQFFTSLLQKEAETNPKARRLLKQILAEQEQQDEQQQEQGE